MGEFHRGLVGGEGRGEGAKLDWWSFGVVVASALALVVGYYQGSEEAFWKRWPDVGLDGGVWRWMWPQLYGGAVSVALHLGVPGVMWGLLRAFGGRRGGEDEGRGAIGGGDGERLGWWWVVGVGLLLWIANPLKQEVPHFVIDNASTEEGLLYVGVRLVRVVGLEVFFRGFMVLGLQRVLGGAGAVGVSLIPYVMVHFNQGMFPSLVGWMVGVCLGVMALRRGSIGLGLGLHAGVVLVGDCVGWWG